MQCHQATLPTLGPTAVAHNEKCRTATCPAPVTIPQQPPPALPPAHPQVKAVASKEEVALAAVARLAAWWLGENANSATGQYAWSALEKDPMPRPVSSADIRWVADLVLVWERHLPGELHLVSMCAPAST